MSLEIARHLPTYVIDFPHTPDRSIIMEYLSDRFILDRTPLVFIEDNHI